MLKFYYHKFIRFFSKFTFRFWQSLGIHITPVHFYQPVPDTRQLETKLWEIPSSINGIDLKEAAQLKFLREIITFYKPEFNLFGLYHKNPDIQTDYYTYNGAFGEVDGDVLYSIIRHYKPKKIIEVGAGWSTHLSWYALACNEEELDVSFELIAIEPFPPSILEKIPPTIITLYRQNVQKTPVDVFKNLQENDILFIDSSHIVSIGSDTSYLFLEILPLLQKGVLVHVHDIFLPWHYPQEWVLKEKRFWNEAYLLQAFLVFNHAFEILWAGHYLSQKYADLFKKTFRGTASQSFWMQKIQ